MKIYCLVAFLALACPGLLVRAQSTDDGQSPAVCTDLTGKVPLPCPRSDDNVALPTDDDSAPAKPAASPELGAKRAAGGKSNSEVTTAPMATAASPTTRLAKPQSGTAAGPPAGVSGAHSSVRPTSLPESIGSEGDPRANIGLSPKTAPEPEPVAVEAVTPVVTRPKSLERNFIRNLIQDQRDIWTSPLKLRLNDVQWLMPLLGGVAVVTASDTDIQNHIPSSASFQKNSNSFSNYGVAAFAGGAGAAYLFGLATRNDHMRETGLLSGEAALNTFALTYAIKNIANRDRPYQGDGHGAFWSKGDSFPSEHAAFAWSVATVVANEYPGPLTKLFAYGSAAAISAARVTADKHFASDALVGTAIGYFVGRQVYRAHHRSGNYDAAYGTFERTRGEGARDPANMGSTFVALDSWVYPAMDRLAALGYINTAFAGLRPWTRMECVRLLEEAGGRLQSESANGGAGAEAARLFRALEAEFVVEAHRWGGDRNLGAQLESIYTRFTGISGKPLNDSYHFGQTIINDYGRPYQEGFNMVTGFTSHAEAGPLAFYVRGEYQHSPSAPAYPLNVRQAIANADANPLQPALPVAAANDLRLLDTYVALNIKDNQLSFGKQSLWWAPNQGGALMFSDNAVPFYMLRWNRVSPTRLPSVLKFLGPMRTDFFIGRLAGHQFPGNPYISGQKVSFKPTQNLEIGFSKLSIFAGGGTPITWHNFYKSNFSVDDGSVVDPGDRRSGFDLRYRIPGLRNWLTIYTDSLADDDPSPLAAPRRAAMNPGIYLSHVPGIPKLDLRAEAVYTDLPAGGNAGGKFVYFNYQYHDSHTNDRNLMGSWVGREGRGLQLWGTYWLAPQSTARVGYRHGAVDQDFVPGGGHLDNVSARFDFTLRHNLYLSSGVQWERWRFPLLSSSDQTNVSATFQLTFRPFWRVSK